MTSTKAKIMALVGVIGALAIALVVSLLSRIGSEMPRVVVVQDKPQEWADALKLGLGDGLREQGLVEGVDFILLTRSAAGDPQGLTGLTEAIARQNFAVIYSLGTQTSEAVFRARPQAPIVFGAVTDPVAAGFFDGSLEKPRGQITGTQDLWPYPAQFDLLVTLVPSAKRIGVVFNGGEINSQVSMRFIRHECEKRNLELLERTVTEESQILAAVAGLLDAGINAFYIPADNTAQTSSRTIIAACTAKRIPVFTGISGIVENGAVGCVGTNYYELGRVNATQIARILRGSKAATIPVQIADRGDIFLNLSTARQLGISIPADLPKRALKIYE
jgi:putative ABC transport system substrate-binding protein